MPAKWKIFRATVYLFIASVMAMGLIPFFVFGYFTFRVRFDSGFLVFFAGLILLMAQGGICLYLVDRCYPDREPTRGINGTASTLFIITILLLLLLFGLFVLGFLDEFFRGRVHWNSPGIKVLVILLLLLLTGTSICWQEVTLRKTIRKNYDKALDSFLG
jgi:hypothetical protein